MLVGVHVSIAGSVDRSVDNAVTRGCTAFQIFTRNPRGWAAKPLSDKDITNFKEKLAASKIDRLATVAHMPYLPNFSSPEQVSLHSTLAHRDMIPDRLGAKPGITLFPRKDRS